jgi:hypothetical protein
MIDISKKIHKHTVITTANMKYKICKLKDTNITCVTWYQIKKIGWFGYEWILSKENDRPMPMTFINLEQAKTWTDIYDAAN